MWLIILFLMLSSNLFSYLRPDQIENKVFDTEKNAKRVIVVGTTTVNFPDTYPLPEKQVNDLKVIIDTTTHSKLESLDGKITKCNTDNISGSVYALPSGTYTVKQSGDWYIKKGTVVVENLIDYRKTASGNMGVELYYGNNNITALSPGNDDLSTGYLGLATVGWLYGYNATTGKWDRLRIDNAKNLMVTDSRYGNKVSTITAGKTISDLTLNITGEMVNFSFLSIGGSAKITGTGIAGEIWLFDGMGVEENLEVPIANPTLNIDVLTSGATVIYTIRRLQ